MLLCCFSASADENGRILVKPRKFVFVANVPGPRLVQQILIVASMLYCLLVHLLLPRPSTLLDTATIQRWFTACPRWNR
jgi:hypothetical protein